MHDACCRWVHLTLPLGLFCHVREEGVAQGLRHGSGSNPRRIAVGGLAAVWALAAAASHCLQLLLYLLPPSLLVAAKEYPPQTCRK